MKINRALLTNGVAKSFEDAIDFSHIEFDKSHIRLIQDCNVKAVATDYESILCIDVEISALVIGVCSYSLEDVEIPLKIKDQLVFTDDETDEDNYYAKDNIIDLDEYILGILLANVPVRIVKKGAKLPDDGSDYRVISEDQYQKEKEKKPDSRWGALDDLDL